MNTTKVYSVKWNGCMKDNLKYLLLRFLQTTESANIILNAIIKYKRLVGTYIYINMCVCVCREREREIKRKRERERKNQHRYRHRICYKLDLYIFIYYYFV